MDSQNPDGGLVESTSAYLDNGLRGRDSSTLPVPVGVLGLLRPLAVIEASQCQFAEAAIRIPRIHRRPGGPPEIAC